MSSYQKHLVVHFERFGPYHLARLNNLRSSLSEMGWTVSGIQVASLDQTYQWDASCNLDDYGIITAFPGGTTGSLSNRQIRAGIHEHLSRLSPTALAIAGWSSPDALACLSWSRKNKRPAVLMSDTRESDGVRVWFKELVKSRRIQTFAAALVAGESHGRYLYKLGFDKPVEYGYDTVDNQYFSSESDRWRSTSSSPNPYLLISSRFVPRKNLLRTIAAYKDFISRYRAESCSPYSLCILGDGPMRQSIITLCLSLGLLVVEDTPWSEPKRSNLSFNSATVYLPGFRQILDLPRFYAHASALLHPALSEPWGLVINEAMASSLPIIASYNCGASEELVIDNFNGFKFDPLSLCSISNALRKFSLLSNTARTQFGLASYSILNSKYPLSAFSSGLRTLLGSVLQ